MPHRYKHVTWSPAVRPVSRPDDSEKKLTPKKTQISVYVPGYPERRICGYLKAHVRNHTKSLLLTIRNKQSGRRDLQLLVNLPNKRVRRVYDGQYSWTVDPMNTTTKNYIRLEVEKFGTITWLGKEEKTRTADAKGFCLNWLLKKVVWPLSVSDRENTGRSTRSKRKSRSVSHKKNYRSKHSKRKSSKRSRRPKM